MNSLSRGEKVFRFGAIAIAAGSSAFLADRSEAALVTQTFNLDFSSNGAVLISTGAPVGSAQYSVTQSAFDYLILNGTAAVQGTCVEGCKADHLSPGATIGPETSDWITVADTAEGEGSVKVGTTTYSGYIGLRFDIDSENDPYGYATIAGTDLVSVTYDDTGAAVTIPTTDTPEPASLSLLALGAAGVAAIRRRRRAVH